jgi:hypothetical protein
MMMNCAKECEYLLRYPIYEIPVEKSMFSATVLILRITQFLHFVHLPKF